MAKLLFDLGLRVRKGECGREQTYNEKGSYGLLWGATPQLPGKNQEV